MGKMVSEDGTQKGGKKDRSNRDGGGRVEWKGYVSPSLTQTEKRAFKKWASNSDEVNRQLQTTIDSGYTLKIDYMENDGAYRAVLYCQRKGHADAGYALSVFAGDWWTAALRVVYCHNEILRSDWSSLTGTRKWKDDWVD